MSGNHSWNSHLLSIKSMSKEDLYAIFEMAAKIKSNGNAIQDKSNYKSFILASLFFQPSTRTRLSFESAANRLGMRIIGFSDGETSRSGSNWKESMSDAASMISGYADLAVVRHPIVDPVIQFSRHSRIPVINAGNGEGLGAEHPTQAILDIFTISERFSFDKPLTVLLACHPSSRCARSLIFALTKFPLAKLVLCLDGGKLFQDDEKYLSDNKIAYRYIGALIDGLAEADVVYMAGFKERADHKVRRSLVLESCMLKIAKPEMIIMHPLPRGFELPYSLDTSRHAAYFYQANNGLPVRMAILQQILDSL
ncbi:hypothetical protein JTE78_25840 [Pseudomonas syringae pv. aptata]|uniref:aspartate/ornithine carbamoyltransferase family protein n=1 Tax=Pseudomonas syringae TaxID=317 RepID=UPI0009AEDD30|nr:hypothetical protein [Pseudomonas syringae]MBI6707069.1 hypothetical protein [Pseudomonas syringae]MCK0546060.1 hypothetical protein [Pseudomonas syringae pv. aptata]